MPRRKKKTLAKSICKSGSKNRDVAKIRFPCRINASFAEHSYHFGNIVLNLKLVEELHLSNTCYLDLYPCGACDIILQDSSNNVDKKARRSGLYNIPFDIMKTLSEIDAMILISCHLHNGNNACKIYFTPSSLVNLESASVPYINRKRRKMFELLEFFFDIKFEDYEMSMNFFEEEATEKIYECITNCYDPRISEIAISDDRMIPKLRPYQCQAVHWMIQQENSINKQVADLHVLYTEIKLPDGQTVYFHKYGGFFVDCKYGPEESCKGGILADEMGLGKTLEVLACILLHPRNDLTAKNNKVSAKQITNDLSYSSGQILNPRKKAKISHFQCVCRSTKDRDSSYTVQCRKCGVIQHADCILYDPDFSADYICPSCWIDKCDSVPSKATLIISPASIIHQWHEEILKNIKKKSLKVFMYEGVQHQKFVDPNYLADCDIVLISYETLKNELSHVNVPDGKDGRVLRLEKKFVSIPSPLCTIQWWRICLDETQVVESVTTKIAQRIGILNSINRWCVTGTPIKKSVEDLYGWLVFLGLKPYDEKVWWEEALFKPFINGNTSPVVSILKDVAWRTVKQNVSDQTRIPEAEKIVHYLKFTVVENEFYKTQFLRCKQNFMKEIEKFGTLDIKIRLLDRSTLSKIMMTLRKLQLSCCYCNISGTEESHEVSSPNDALSLCMAKTKNRCEDLFGKLALSMNGLAGVYTVRKDFQKAVDIYQQVIEFNEVKIDSILKIHALYNLSTILVNCHNGPVIQSKFTVPKLSSDLDKNISDYVEKNKRTIKDSLTNYSKAAKDVSKILNKFKLKQQDIPTSAWWLKTFEQTEDKNALLANLKDALENAPGQSILSRKVNFRGCIQGFTILNITSHVKNMSCILHEIRKRVKEKVELCASELNSDELNQAICCHIRPVPNATKCKYCQVDAVIWMYREKLFRCDEKDEEAYTKGLRPHIIYANGELELIMKFFLNLSQHMDDPKCIADGQNEVKLFDALKKEFKSLVRIYLETAEYVNTRYAIEIAKLRMRLYDLREPIPNIPRIYILFPHEVMPKYREYLSETKSFEVKAKKKLGNYCYLKNLEKAGKNGKSDDFCPVCQQTLEDFWALLLCGHSFCLSCMSRLSGKNRSEASCGTCPVCRAKFSQSDIHYVLGNAQDYSDVKGRFSTKTTAVVKFLLNRKKWDPKAKSVIFSSFLDFLGIIETALKYNDIQSVNFCNKKDYQENLKKFKESEDINVLLIPLDFQCSGLNLTEATHVLLLEPVIDYSKHLQAIGSIHRIGQTKKVKIHHFVMNKSIEESIFEIQEPIGGIEQPEMTLRNIVQIFQSCEYD